MLQHIAPPYNGNKVIFAVFHKLYSRSLQQYYIIGFTGRCFFFIIVIAFSEGYEEIKFIAGGRGKC